VPEDVFDEPSQWRHEAILALGLEGEERIAGAVTGVAYPDALAPILAARPEGLTTIGDLGAGLGGAAEWFRSRSGAAVLAVEPEAPATLAARQLFPQVRIARATAGALPWADGACGVVTLLGVISLLRDPGPALREASGSPARRRSSGSPISSPPATGRWCTGPTCSRPWPTWRRR